MDNMDSVEAIKAIELRHAPASSLTDEEWQERLRNWERDRARQREDEGELLVNLRRLTAEQAATLAQWALRRYDVDSDSREWLQVLGRVANFVDGGLLSIYPELLERKLLWPGKMFRCADQATRDRLIELVEATSGNTHALNNLLLCLAWVGDETVQALFQSWREHPPAWHTQLYIAPETYSVEAGWELTPAGGRRDLFYNTSFELIPATDAPDAQSNVVRAALPDRVAGEACGWCGRDLSILFELDLRDSRLAFLRLRGTQLRVARCEFCSPCATIYIDVDLEGGVRWSASNGPRPRDFDSGWAEYPLIGRQLVLGPRRRTPAETVGVYQGARNSELGGHPNWIQDAEYPVCPGCQRRMMFLGQVETADVIEGAEGITYAFLCADCLKTATMYQQT